MNLQIARLVESALSLLEGALDQKGVLEETGPVPYYTLQESWSPPGSDDSDSSDTNDMPELFTADFHEGFGAKMGDWAFHKQLRHFFGKVGKIYTLPATASMRNSILLNFKNIMLFNALCNEGYTGKGAYVGIYGVAAAMRDVRQYVPTGLLGHIGHHKVFLRILSQDIHQKGPAYFEYAVKEKFAWSVLGSYTTQHPLFEKFTSACEDLVECIGCLEDADEIADEINVNECIGMRDSSVDDDVAFVSRGLLCKAISNLTNSYKQAMKDTASHDLCCLQSLLIGSVMKFFGETLNTLDFTVAKEAEICTGLNTSEDSSIISGFSGLHRVARNVNLIYKIFQEARNRYETDSPARGELATIEVYLGHLERSVALLEDYIDYLCMLPICTQLSNFYRATNKLSFFWYCKIMFDLTQILRKFGGLASKFESNYLTIYKDTLSDPAKQAYASMLKTLIPAIESIGKDIKANYITLLTALENVLVPDCAKLTQNADMTELGVDGEFSCVPRLLELFNGEDSIREGYAVINTFFQRCARKENSKSPQGNTSSDDAGSKGDGLGFLLSQKKAHLIRRRETNVESIPYKVAPINEEAVDLNKGGKNSNDRAMDPNGEPIDTSEELAGVNEEPVGTDGEPVGVNDEPTGIYEAANVNVRGNDSSEVLVGDVPGSDVPQNESPGEPAGTPSPPPASSRADINMSSANGRPWHKIAFIAVGIFSLCACCLKYCSGCRKGLCEAKRTSQS